MLSTQQRVSRFTPTANETSTTPATSIASATNRRNAVNVGHDVDDMGRHDGDRKQRVIDSVLQATTNRDTSS
jgi:hypothetical protein